MAAAAILDFQKFDILTVIPLYVASRPLCVTNPNSVIIRQTVAEIWRFNGFFSKWRHLGFVGRDWDNSR